MDSYENMEIFTIRHHEFPSFLIYIIFYEIGWNVKCPWSGWLDVEWHGKGHFSHLYENANSNDFDENVLFYINIQWEGERRGGNGPVVFSVTAGN